jgi:hypothetical protein
MRTGYKHSCWRAKIAIRIARVASGIAGTRETGVEA